MKKGSSTSPTASLSTRATGAPGDTGRNRFELRLELLRLQPDPQHIGDAAAYVHDSMEIAWVASQSIFGREATVEGAIAIFDRIDRERLRLLALVDED